MKWTSFFNDNLLFFILGATIGAAVIIYSMGLWTNLSIKDYLDLLGVTLMLTTACVAARINFMHLKWQRQSRIWELNKDLFINLILLLTKAIEHTNIAYERALEETVGYCEHIPERKELPDSTFFKELDAELKKVESIYIELFPKDICIYLNKYFATRRTIRQNHENGDYSSIDGFDETIENYNLLLNTIRKSCSQFIQ